VTGRVLIVNGDDFGRSQGVNRGVIAAYERGILTSASLMVRWPVAAKAAAYARGKSLSVGLHLDLGEWVYRDDQWRIRYEVVESQSPATIRGEINRQLKRFEQLMGSFPTHLDSHQHVHEHEPTRSELRLVGERLGVPVRNVFSTVKYSGRFYGQDGSGRPFPDGITVDALIAQIEDLQPGVTEIGCHPATEVDHDSSYAIERVQELQTLCDPRVREAISRRGVTLGSFADLRESRIGLADSPG
jgi:chitin disaccharide deacetylase